MTFLILAAAMLVLLVFGGWLGCVAPEVGSTILPEAAPEDPFADHRAGCGCTWHR